MHPRGISQAVRRIAFGIALLVTISCGSAQRKLYPVRGKVLCDGRPAEGAVVALYAQDASQPMEKFPRGVVKADGSFAVGTFEPADGAPPGDYKVVIVWMAEDPKILPSGRFATKLPEQYTSPTTTPLSLQVKEGANDVAAYELTSPNRTRP